MMANFYSYKISKVGYIHDLMSSIAGLNSLFLYLSPTNITTTTDSTLQS